MTRILVVEDDPAAAALLTLTLQREGYEVSVVGTAAEALAAVRRGVQCVLLDLGLPDMEGVRACAELRGVVPGLPILVVSARASESDIVVALDAGADDYLVKPFRTQELLARLRTLLRRTSNADLLHVGDLSLDAAAFRASVRGVTLALTRKEYEVLSVLARNAGRVVLREDIIRSLWRDPLPAKSKTLDMHVSALRRKLAAAGAGNTIATVRGRGFSLEP